MKKKKKKKGLGDTATANITSGVKKSVGVVGKYAAGAVGLAASYFLLSRIPKSNIVLVDKVLPGIAAMTLGFVVGTRVDNPALKFAAAGLGIAGAADLLKKAVWPMLPASIQSAVPLPTLSGMGMVPGYKAVNQGDYPPNYYRDNAFQGLGTSPYALSGGGMGTSPYALSGNEELNGMGTSPYALSGVGNN